MFKKLIAATLLVAMATGVYVYAQVSNVVYFDPIHVLFTAEANQHGATIQEPVAPTPPQEGLVFMGWYTDKTWSYQWNFSTDLMPAEDLKLFALWSPNPHPYKTNINEVSWSWINTYADNHVFRYDVIVAENQHARMFIPSDGSWILGAAGGEYSRIEFFNAKEEPIMPMLSFEQTNLIGEVVTFEMPADTYRMRIWVNTSHTNPQSLQFLQHKMNSEFNLELNQHGYEAYPITVNYDSSWGSASCNFKTAYEGEFVTCQADPIRGYFNGWTSQVLNWGQVGEHPRPQRTISFTMPNGPVIIDALFSSKQHPDRSMFSVSFSGTPFEMEIVSDIDPAYFTRERLRYAHIYVNGELKVLNGRPLQSNVWTYDDRPDMNRFNLDMVMHSGDGFATLFAELYYGAWQPVAGVPYQQGDVDIYLGGTDPLYTLGDLVIDFYLIDVDPLLGIEMPTRGAAVLDQSVDNLLSMWGFNNDIGYMVLLLGMVLIVTLTLAILKLPVIVILIVDLAIAGMFVANSMMPLWAIVMFFGVFALGVVWSLKGGVRDGV